MPVSVAAGAEVDGHSINIGALADTSSQSTVIGLLKFLKAAGVMATGAASPTRLIAAAGTNATLVKSSAGAVYGWHLYNAAAYPVFLKLYNASTAPTAGSGTPALTIPIPAGAAANIEFTKGIAFGTGIGFTITKLAADTDATSVVAGDLVVNLLTV
jgi:hypothetical protein